MVFSTLKIITQKHVKHFKCFLFILGHDADQSSGGGMHGGTGHHLRLVFAETLGAVDGELLALQLLEDGRLVKEYDYTSLNEFEVREFLLSE